jgi:hypothetical protein
MFFDLEIIFLHTVLPIQNQQEISRCLEKMMVQSWFNDHAPDTLFYPRDDYVFQDHDDDDPANAHRVHPVQRLHRAIRVPPARGQSVKFGDFRPKRRCFRQGDALSSPDPL